MKELGGRGTVAEIPREAETGEKKQRKVDDNNARPKQLCSLRLLGPPLHPLISAPQWAATLATPEGINHHVSKYLFHVNGAPWSCAWWWFCLRPSIFLSLTAPPWCAFAMLMACGIPTQGRECLRAGPDA